MGQNSSAAAGVAPSSSVGVVGRSHMAEVQAEDENLAYRRGVKLLDTDDRREIDRRVTERLRFCCEEEWKDYLRCMEGRALSQNPECFPIKEKANVCVERLNRAQITATSEKRHVMNILQVCAHHSLETFAATHFTGRSTYSLGN